jgi:hypothetical protein
MCEEIASCRCFWRQLESSEVWTGLVDLFRNIPVASFYPLEVVLLRSLFHCGFV